MNTHEYSYLCSDYILNKTDIFLLVDVLDIYQQKTYKLKTYKLSQILIKTKIFFTIAELSATQVRKENY